MKWYIILGYILFGLLALFFIIIILIDFIYVIPNINKTVLYKDLPFTLKFKLESKKYKPDDKFIIKKKITTTYRRYKRNIKISYIAEPIN